MIHEYVPSRYCYSNFLILEYYSESKLWGALETFLRFIDLHHITDQSPPPLVDIKIHIQDIETINLPEIIIDEYCYSNAEQ